MTKGGLAGALALALAVPVLSGETAPLAVDVPGTGASLRQAQATLDAARQRAARLDQFAREASASADRTRQEAAAVAARIQTSEAEIALARARIAVLERDRAALRRDLARRQEPIVRLTAALELMARRPLGFSLLRRQSLGDMVHTRAVLESVVPEVRRRTAGLRGDIARARSLEEREHQAIAGLARSAADLAQRQRDLATIESRQRIAERAAHGDASREGDRVLALAEETHDLGKLVDRLHQDAALAARLAALPGPVPRPDRRGVQPPDLASTPSSRARFTWIMPVAGQLVTGFGEPGPAGTANGLTLAVGGGAEVVAPAAGRIAFAGPYRGFGRIVIIEHDDGWSSLVTDLGRLDVTVGQMVVQGSPLGASGPGRSSLRVELRKDGRPVNPLRP